MLLVDCPSEDRTVEAWLILLLVLQPGVAGKIPNNFEGELPGS